jgi:hypothetical protein
MLDLRGRLGVQGEALFRSGKHSGLRSSSDSVAVELKRGCSSCMRIAGERGSVDGKEEPQGG